MATLQKKSCLQQFIDLLWNSTNIFSLRLYILSYLIEIHIFTEALYPMKDSQTSTTPKTMNRTQISEYGGQKHNKVDRKGGQKIQNDTKN